MPFKMPSVNKNSVQSNVYINNFTIQNNAPLAVSKYSSLNPSVSMPFLTAHTSTDLSSYLSQKMSPLETLDIQLKQLDKHPEDIEY